MSRKILFMFLRRSILVALLLASGCATPGVQCGISDDYTITKNALPQGAVYLTWSSGHQLPGKLADALCIDTAAGRQCHVRFVEKPSFNNVCGLAVLGHELVHAFGAVHRER